jgi:hypothetical protein
MRIYLSLDLVLVFERKTLGFEWVFPGNNDFAAHMPSFSPQRKCGISDELRVIDDL